MNNDPTYDISSHISLEQAVVGANQSRLDTFTESGNSGQINTDEILTVREFPTQNLSKVDALTFADDVEKRVTDYTHGIHTYPAKFVPQIPRWAFRYAELKKGDTVYDPFVGCGTAMVEARLCGLNSYGAEISPLGRMMTKVKTEPIFRENPTRIREITAELLAQIHSDDREEVLDEDKNKYFSPPINWEFWFPNKSLKDLTNIKRHILTIDKVVDVNFAALQQLSRFYLICLSSVIIPASYQQETQIKVRKNEQKFDDGLPDTTGLFSAVTKENQEKLVEFNKACGHDELFAEIVGTDARKHNLPNNSTDLVVTSPPYINAIDYTMAHRRSLLFLDFFDKESFYEHRHEYIGVTERAVTKQYYNTLQLTGSDEIDEIIKIIYKKGERKDKIRAYILYQYFTGMREVFQQLSDVLKPEGYCVIVVGDNEIRNETIPTAEFLVEVTKDTDLALQHSFKHFYKKIQLQAGRRSTAGKIDYETILILQNS